MKTGIELITEETKIQNTELPKRIKNILSNCHIYTIEDLIKCDKSRLMRIRGFGKANIMVLVNFVNDSGFYFNN